ncbi:MAG: VCBS repeat-containing protein [Candidatus Sabulitectum sp.]|nr:VCBS repeat-containing protein [Candidatus Sabulitectum sp.]
MDLVLSNYYGKLFLYRRLSNGALTEEPVLCASDYEIDMGYWCGPQFVDWNEDGYLDLLLSGYGSGMYSNRFTLFMNTNDNPDSPTFVSTGISKVETVNHRWRQGIRVFDLNQDGKKDLIGGNENGEMFYHENTGTNAAPEFDGKVSLQTEAGVIDMNSRARCCVWDWNNDGTPDLVVGNGSGDLYLFLGIPDISTENNTVEEIYSGGVSLTINFLILPVRCVLLQESNCFVCISIQNYRKR